MAIAKLGRSKVNQPMHYSVGAIIKRGNKYLLIDRNIRPFGYACIAGHVDKGESAIRALIREVKEESGLKVVKHKMLCKEELDWNWCSRGIKVHYWCLFNCKVAGRVNQNFVETKNIGWYAPAQIKKLLLEPVWAYWFKKLKIL